MESKSSFSNNPKDPNLIPQKKIKKSMSSEQPNKNSNKQENMMHWMWILSKWSIKIKYSTTFQMPQIQTKTISTQFWNNYKTKTVNESKINCLF